MSEVTLDCTYTSLWEITDILWQKKNSNKTTILDQSKDTDIYSGGTINKASLTIKRMKETDNGIYRCFVQNKFGFGRGNDIVLQIKPGLY